MGLRIKTNTPSQNAQRLVGQTTDRLNDTMSKLASGSRINKAADDAARLAVSENLRADIRSLNQAVRNAMDGVSLVQVAEGGLMETTNMVVRLRELAVQAASDTIGNTERGFLDKEYQALKLEIDRIANSTEFNGTRLLTGQTQLNEEMQTGSNSFPLEIQVDKDYMVGMDALDSDTPVNVIRINLQNLNGFSTGEGSLMINESLNGESIAGISDKKGAQLSISRLDKTISRIIEMRTEVGAIQSHFTHEINNQRVHIENLAEARSRLTDADYAVETANYTKDRILQQSGTIALAQANSQPSIALSLLNSL
jgi:flagellin